MVRVGRSGARESAWKSIECPSACPVHQRDLEDIAHAPVQRGPGSRSVEAPAREPHTGGDVEALLGHRERDPVDSLGGHERQNRVVCREAGFRGAVQVEGGQGVRRGRSAVAHGVPRGLAGRHRCRAAGRRSGPARPDGQGHPHLPVADDRAPSVEVAAYHPDVEHLPRPGCQPPRAAAVGQHQVVDIRGIGVDHVEYQPVAAGDRDAARGESHVLCLDADRGRLTRCDHAAAGRATGGADGQTGCRWIHSDPDKCCDRDGGQARHQLYQQRAAAVPRDLGQLDGSACRGGAGGAGSGHLAAGPHGGPDAQHHQRQEGGQRGEDEHRDRDADQAGNGSQAEHESRVGDDHATEAEALRVSAPGADHRRAAAEYRRQQVGEGAEHHLEREADHEHRGDPPVVLVHRRP